MSSLYSDILTIIDQDGTTRGEIGAVVDKNRIITQDASLLVEVGDTIERELPHDRKETLSVTHVQFFRGLGGIPGFYDITTGGPNPLVGQVDRPGVAVYVSESPHARVNLHSVDNSISAVNTQGHEVFRQTRHLIQTQVDDAAERALLLQSVDEMEATHQSGDFLAGYKHFMGLAADHMSVFAPVVSALASLL